MEKNNRNIQFHFYATEQEAEMINERREASGISNMSAYLRKMAIDGYNIQIDLSDVKELVTLLRRCSNNLNQYARRANETRSIYATDVQDIKEQLDRMWEVANKTMEWLSKVP